MSLHLLSILRRKMKPHFGTRKQGYRLRSILIHSLWITVVGIVLFRLATAKTQRHLFTKIFAVSGVILITAPWIIQLLASTTIIFLYKAEVCDLSWLLKSPSEEDSGCRGSGVADEDDEV